MPTTEIVTLPLKPGSTIGDADSEAASVLKEANQTLSQAAGCQQILYGTQVENPEVLQMLIDWDSLEHHRNFEKQEEYPAFVQRFMAGAGGPPSFSHVDFQPEGGLNQSLAAPLTEVATFFFDGAPPADYVEKALKFREAVEKEQGSEYLGAAIGVTYEELEREGVKGKAAVLTIGWSSVDAHLKFRETQVFKDNIHLLRDGATGAELVHVKFAKFQAN